jgi:hypothetical protein
VFSHRRPNSFCRHYWKQNSCVFDAQLTSVIDKMVKVWWYDNEIGYSSKNNRFNSIDSKIKPLRKNKQQMRYLLVFFFLLIHFSTLKQKRVQIAFYIPILRILISKKTNIKTHLILPRSTINYCDNNGKDQPSKI